MLNLTLELGAQPTKLPKGDYTVRLQLRHDRMELLDKLRDVALLAERALAKELTLPVYGDPNALVTDGAKFAAKKLRAGEKAVCFVGGLRDEPREAAPGDVLVGWLSLVKEDVKARKLDGIPFTYVITGGGAAKGANSGASSSSLAASGEGDEKSSAAERQERAVLAAKVEFLARLLAQKQHDDLHALAAPLLAAHPQHLPLLRLMLRAAEDSQLDRVLAAADVRISCLVLLLLRLSALFPGGAGDD